jgi:hypothetical protein
LMVFIHAAAIPEAQCKCWGHMRLDWFIGWNSFGCFNDGNPCDSSQGTCNEVTNAQGTKQCRCVNGETQQQDQNCKCTLQYAPVIGVPTRETIDCMQPKECVRGYNPLGQWYICDCIIPPQPPG